jgi:hypothetical protein
MLLNACLVICIIQISENEVTYIADGIAKYCYCL